MDKNGVVILGLLLFALLIFLSFGIVNVICKLLSHFEKQTERIRPGWILVIADVVAAFLGYKSVISYFESDIESDFLSFIFAIYEEPIMLVISFLVVGIATLVLSCSKRLWKNHYIGFLIPLIVLFAPIVFEFSFFIVVGFLFSFVLSIIGLFDSSATSRYFVYIFKDK